MFGEKLKELRKSRGMSQEDLSEMLDVSRQSISKYENGTAQPDFEKLALITKLFDVSYDYLLSEEKAVAKEPKLVAASKDNRISIISKIDGRLSSYYKFRISKVHGKRDYHPAAMLIGVDTSSFWGDDATPLAWYATLEDAEKEVKQIYEAIGIGESSYELKYATETKKKGIFDIQIAD